MGHWWEHTLYSCIGKEIIAVFFEWTHLSIVEAVSKGESKIHGQSQPKIASLSLCIQILKGEPL